MCQALSPLRQAQSSSMSEKSRGLLSLVRIASPKSGTCTIAPLMHERRKACGGDAAACVAWDLVGLAHVGAKGLDPSTYQSLRRARRNERRTVFDEAQLVHGPKQVVALQAH